jgi:hypothetical protein
MAKNKQPRVKICSKIFTGFLDEMPQEVKDQMKAEKPKSYERIFEPKTEAVE